MNSVWNKAVPAVRKETGNVAFYTVVGVLVMWGVYGGMQGLLPEIVSLDAAVFLGGICGGLVAVLNFFFMGLAVQKATVCRGEEEARILLKGSYTRRMFMQALWIILAAVTPCIQLAAGIFPLFFPGIGIKMRGLWKRGRRMDDGYPFEI